MTLDPADPWTSEAPVEAPGDTPEEVEEVVLVEEVEELVLVEEVEAELVLPVWEPTGEPRVDAALDLLASLDPDDVHGHADVYDAVHRQLREALTDLDAASS